MTRRSAILFAAAAALAGGLPPAALSDGAPARRAGETAGPAGPVTGRDTLARAPAAAAAWTHSRWSGR